MGTLQTIAAGSTKSSSSGSSFLIIIAVFAVMMIFLFRSQRRRQRQAVDTQRQVMDGSKIRTTFGLFGTVISGDDRTVMVEIAPGVEVKLLRQAVAAVVPDEEPDASYDPDDSYDTADDEAEDEKPGSQNARTDLSI